MSTKRAIAWRLLMLGAALLVVLAERVRDG